jgi:hypothetical protein
MDALCLYEIYQTSSKWRGKLVGMQWVSKTENTLAKRKGVAASVDELVQSGISIAPRAELTRDLTDRSQGPR